MENQDEWIEQPKRTDWNKVLIAVVFAANIGILTQAILLYLFL